MNKHALIHGTAFIASLAAGAGLAAGLLTAARGETRGAPGVTKAFARIGRLAGGSMTTGVALTGGAAALTGLAVYEGIKRLDR